MNIPTLFAHYALIPYALIPFFFIAVVAGGVDAVAGGGGLITLPLLLIAGVPPAAAVATNKLGSIGGSLSATLYFIKIGRIPFRSVRLMTCTTFAGAILGGMMLTRVNSECLYAIISALLIGFSLYFLLMPTIGKRDRKGLIGPYLFAVTAAPLIGGYDGFFGPGTGTFFCATLTILRGFSLINATAHAKLLNLSSNSAALCFFLAQGVILWPIGLVLLAGQLIGGYLGAQIAMKHGTTLIKVIMVVMAIAVSLKLLTAS